MLYHIISFFAGFILDLILGDPYWLPHPVRLIGSLISKLEKWLLPAEEARGKNNGKRTDEYQLKMGRRLVYIVLLCTGTVSFLLLYAAYRIHPAAGVAAESIMTYQILAVKCLRQESMKVYVKLKEKDLREARKAVSMIVGRDTDCLDETGVTKAAVETVAENISDGIIAPMLYLAAGGPVLGFLYKAVNTMDSMVGYKNDKYLCFGRAAARLDDALNYIPARISALLMIGASFFMGKDFSGKHAFVIFKRDRRKHASPNSAQTEAACAGALGIRLAGDACYFGKTVKKPYIGDELRAVEYEDIVRVNKLLYASAVLCQCICLSAMLFLYSISK